MSAAEKVNSQTLVFVFSFCICICTCICFCQPFPPSLCLPIVSCRKGQFPDSGVHDIHHLANNSAIRSPSDHDNTHDNTHIMMMHHPISIISSWQDNCDIIMIMYHPYQYFVFMIIVVVIFLIRCCCKCLPDKSRGNIIKSHNFTPTCTFILPPPHALLLKQNLNLMLILISFYLPFHLLYGIKNPSKSSKQIYSEQQQRICEPSICDEGQCESDPSEGSYNNGTLLPGNYND